MERKFFRQLQRWYEDKSAEPLMLIGARQVGKTWLVEEFCGRTDRELISLNFELIPDLDDIFSDSLEPERIMHRLEALLGRRIEATHCILFFDEIQRSERAINSLKYFCESKTDYRIICAGSLLGVKLNRFTSSFPVGKVRLQKLYPMDFEEFLWAAGAEALAEEIRASYREMKPLPEALHKRALSFYYAYLYVGGMPAAVKQYLEEAQDVMRFDRDIHRSILTAYLADMRKYTLNAGESVKIAETYESLPKQLAKENPKFQYKAIRQGADKRGYQSALSWLKAAEIVYDVNKVSFLQSPLKAYTEEGYFKIYYSDVGLLSTTVGMPYQEIISDTHNLYRGSLTENYCAQSFTAAGIPLYYYSPSRYMEIDYLLDCDGDIIPVEAKAGRHKHSNSLNSYCEKNHPAYAIRLSARNFGRDDRIRSIPLYAVFCLGKA